jgi:hypothetical protein
MSHSGRGSAGWWEVLRGECSDRFESERGRWLAWCGASGQRRSVGFILRKKKAGGVGWEAEAQWGAGERAGWGGREVAAAGPKTRAGPKFKK